MFIKFEIKKNKEYWLLAAFSSLLSGLLAYMWGVSLVMSIVIGLVLCAVLTVRLHFEENTPLWVSAIICGVFSFIIYVEAQFAVGSTPANVEFVKLIVNWALVYGLVLLIAVACKRLKYALIAVQALVLLLATIDHFVVQSRGMELQFADLFSFGTAMSVVGQYHYTLSARAVAALIFALLTTAFLVLNRMPKIAPLKIRIGGLAVSVLSLTLSVLLVITSWGRELIGYEVRFWKIQSTTENGFLVSLIHSISAAKVSRPNGYSKDTLVEMLGDYSDQMKNPLSPPESESPEPPSDDPVVSEPKQTSPNIIVIMNETFTDLASISEYLGYEMLTDTELLPYFSSLSDDAPNISKGFAMSSVFGGNTANSEFEFLTGNTMAFLPANMVAYNLYVKKDNSFSVVDIMKKCGYLTVGLHPEPGSNWNRNEIYGYYGFEESYFLEESEDGTSESFVSDESLSKDDYYRGHVSDRTVYDRIIDLYEQKEDGTPLFTFAVTMQNHGGYASKVFDYTVRLEDKENVAAANEYLTSIQQSDQALKELIEYFEAAEEDTLILFFGDHQPSLSADFYSEYFGLTDESSDELVQAKYVVPYLYWGNFDFETDIGEITSINYLSSHMLEIAGLPKTEYLNFTDLVEQEIIAINAYGWLDKDRVFHLIPEDKQFDSPLLQIYQYLQYNALFDSSDNKLTEWFILSEEPMPASKEENATV